MIFRYKCSALGLIFFLLGTCGCKKFVEIAPPETELVTASVFDKNAAASAAQTGIYTQLYNTSVSFHISLDGGLLSDEFYNYNSNTSSLTQEYINGMVANNSYGQWSVAYNFIYQENAILEALAGNNALTPSVVQQLTGEALFVRAYWHFYLTTCYGDIPIVTSTDYAVNNTISRSPRALVFQQIVADLQKAQSLMSSNFVNADDTSFSAQTERVRPTKWAATALLARAYLYLGNWTGADSAASAVIGNAMFRLPVLDSVFLKNSSETIWQVQIPTPPSKNTEDGQFYVLTSAPNGTTNSGVTLSPQLLSAFEPGDKRFVHWVDSIVFPGATYYFPYKYKGTAVTFTATGTVTEYNMMLRLAEQYLIRAEAEAQLNQLTAAANDINTIRTRAGLGGTSAATQADLLTAILHERQVELFTEWGYRWFDLVRTGNVNAVMGAPGNVTHYKGGAWVAADTLFPIPQSEINLNGNLTQNVGY